MLNLNSYHMDRARKPALIIPNLLPYSFSLTSKFKRSFGRRLSFAGVQLKNNKRYFILGTKEDFDFLKKSVLNKIVNDEKFVEHSLKRSNKSKNKLLKYVKSNTKKLRNCSNKKLSYIVAKYFSLYEEFNAYPVTYTIFLTDQLHKHLISEIDSKDRILLEFPYFTYTENHEIEFYKKSRRIAQKMSEKWSWIPFDYIGPNEYNMEYYLKKMNIDVNYYEKKIKEKKVLQEKQNKIIKRYNKRIRRLIRDYHKTIYLADRRKMVVTITHTYLQKFIFQEISRRTKLSKRELTLLTPEEIKNAIIKNKYPKDISTRMNLSLIINDGKSFKVYKKDILPKSDNDLKGMVANKGLARGHVKICFEYNDLKNVKKGDIIVAPMTYPYFVNTMKKASGIITDEGGITSHAAVLSRELGIPCIIGTRNATSVLKDGDFVELDANNNKIKIIK